MSPRKPGPSPAPEKALFWLLVGLLLWVPIPLGSNRPWAAAVLEVGVFLLLMAWGGLWAAGRVHVPSVATKAIPALAVLLLWVLEQAIHVVPLPMGLVESLSPAAAEAHHLVDGLGVSRDTVTLSVDPYASKLSLLKTLAFSGTFLLCLLLVNSRHRIRVLLLALVGGAVIHSVYAVFMHLEGVTDSLFGTVIPHGAQASGTFPNRNHFAGYLEMTLALGIGLLIAGLSDRKAESWREFFRNTLDWMLSPKMVLRLSLCVLVIALTTTHSRMGNTAFFASLLVAGLIGIALSRNATRNTVILLASLVIIDLAIVGSWFGVERLVQRLEETTSQEILGREEPAVQTLGMIRKSPVFGVGPGSFYVSFEAYRPETVLMYYDYTHNDYAQFVSESGLLGIGLIGLFVLMALFAAIRAQWVRRDPLMRGISFACVMAVIALLIHSSADFNLQIPANSMYFMVILALGWISLFHDRHFVDPVKPRG